MGHIEGYKPHPQPDRENKHMDDKERTSKPSLPPLWNDDSNLRMTNSHPSTDEDALLKRSIENEAHRADDTDDLLSFMVKRYDVQK